MSQRYRGNRKKRSANGENKQNNRRPSNNSDRPRNSKPGNRNGKRRSSGNKGGGRRSGFKPSTLDASLFEKRAVHREEVKFEADRSFNEFPIHNQLKSRLERKGFEKPTEIQDRSIESLLKGRDILGIAQTGTGKTAAFLIPIIEHMIQKKTRGFHALIVVPTRELALQVNEEFKSMTKGLKLWSACFIGGTNINRDLQNLRRPSQVIVGTPGRLIDLNNRKALDFRNFNVLVLDEFDRMLDMGFAKDMDRMIENMPHRNQTMLFSATLDKSQEDRIDSILSNPVRVQVSTGDTSGDNIDQEIIELEKGQDKFDVLFDMLQQEEFSKVLIFDETKNRVNKLCKKLNGKGVRSEQIQGNKSQNARQKALKLFRDGKIQCLVATDVAARGIDVDDVTHVINFQKPLTYDTYIHRIGRTGRAGKTGKAYTFVD